MTPSRYIRASPGGCALRVGPQSKTWRLEYRQDGKSKAVMLGRYPEISLKEARQMAADEMVFIVKGNDPAQQKRDYRDAETVAGLWPLYLATPKARKKSEKTKIEELRYWKAIEKALGDMKVVDVRPRDCAAILNEKAKKAPVAANRMYGLMTRCSR